MLTELESNLMNRFKQGSTIILESKVDYVEFGIFGSFARGDIKCGSDVDFVLIVDDLSMRKSISALRSDLEDIGCDLAVLLKNNFDNPQTLFAEKVKRDYRRVHYVE